jgi:hypothetical protein
MELYQTKNPISSTCDKGLINQNVQGTQKINLSKQQPNTEMGK